MIKIINFILVHFLFSSIVLAQVSNTSPNILFIAVDDLKPTIGAFGEDLELLK